MQLRKEAFQAAPGPGAGGHDSSRVSHGLHARGASEQGTGQGARGKRVDVVVLASKIVDCGVEDVIDQREHATRVTHERTTFRDVIQHRVELQFGG